MTPPLLARRGRAAIDFWCSVNPSVAHLQRGLEVELVAAEIQVKILPDHIDVRHLAIAKEAGFVDVPGTAIGRRARHVLVAIRL